ncbi:MULTISPECIES: DUF4168 domain-containing protein [unclassified Wenzhouxiangella]|uniref:DUF4168 domain-containing protein n=1 Tax=unclassified Wenzhouxiangella TaxID=2613841 RepID=UPI000E329273|nr:MULTISPECIES: DUF4168 domain-containing protein [unclassified Wenzhouxiangella]RFF27990.1 DUF4168 domain-containing protein [Wenzhouxiangella sp. 15181]RFP68577.1 DUF4168 domain-containing protein [Wenzhouxiangella sp. 15190]
MTIGNTSKLFAALIALTFSLAVVAQEGQQTQPQQQQPETIDVSDQQLEQFAEAQTEISGIQQDFSSRLQEVEDPEKAQDLQRQANEEMTAAVEDAGLDVESFNQIAMAIQNDPELQQKLTEMLQQ